MIIELSDEELQVFCDLLVEARRDSYVQPSTAWTKLPLEQLDREFDNFKKKRKQAIAKVSQNEQGKNDYSLIHFDFFQERTTHQIKQGLYEDWADCFDKTIIRNDAELAEAFMSLQWILDGITLLPFSIEEKIKKLGMSIDFSGCSEWHKRHIALQATAQVISYLEGHCNIRKIKEKIIRFDSLRIKLTYLDRYKSVKNYDENYDGFEFKDCARAIEKAISTINPIPKDKRRGRNSHQAAVFKDIITIPELFNEKDGLICINFQRLRVAISYLTVSFAYNRCNYDQVVMHPLILHYKAPLHVLFHGLVDVWIEETFKFLKNILNG